MRLRRSASELKMQKIKEPRMDDRANGDAPLMTVALADLVIARSKS